MNDVLKLIAGLALSALLALLPAAEKAEQQPRIDTTEAIAAVSPPVLLDDSRVIVASDMRSAPPRVPIMLAQYPAVEIDPNAEPIEPEPDPVPNAPAAPEHDATTLKLLEIAKQIQADADRLEKLSEETDKKIAEGFGTFKLPETIAAPATCQCNCDCPTLDQIRQVIREELRAMSTAKGVDATQEQIEKVAAGFDPITGIMAEGSTIVMITQDYCPPCNLWWAQERPQYEARGWKVLKVPVEGTGAKQTPTFRVFTKGQWKQHDGFMTTTAARQLVGIDPPAASASTATAGASQETIQVIYRDSLPASGYGGSYGAPQQDCYSGACSAPAWLGETLSGMPFSAPPMVPQFAGGNCVGGACGTSAAPRGGLFGGFFRR